MAIVQDDPKAVLNEVNGQLDKRNVKRKSISGDRLEDDAIGSSQIAADAVGPSEIAPDAVGSSEIAASAVNDSELGDISVHDYSFNAQHTLIETAAINQWIFLAGVTWWTAKFIVQATGRGASTATAGTFDIAMPPNGTTITGHGGASNITVNATPSMTLVAGTSLWYDLPLGSGSATVNTNFHVVGTSSDFTIPETWVWLCTYHPTNGILYTATGRKLYGTINDNELGSPNNSTYKVLSQTTSTFPVVAAATYWPTQSGTWISAGGSASGNQGIWYFKETDFDVGNLTTKCRFIVEIGCNATAPFAGASTFTFGLKTVSNFTGGAGVVGVALGATITGSTCVFTQPAANTGYESSATTAVVTTASTDFNMPATGLVIPFCTTSAATQANSFVQVNTYLEARNT